MRIARWIATGGLLASLVGCANLVAPPYSPDYNPSENCISKLKQFLRRAKARTLRKLNRALAKALATIAPEDIVGWFVHCGYVYSFE